MTLEDIKALIEQLNADPSTTTDEQLAQAHDALREIVAEARTKQEAAEVDPSKRLTPADVKQLQEVQAAKKAIAAEETTRANAAAKLDEDTRRLLEDLSEPEPPAEDATPDGDTPAKAEDADEPDGGEGAPQGRSADLEAVAASLAATASVLASAVAAKPAAPAEVQGRPAGRLGANGQSPNAPAPSDVVTAHTFGGQDKAGSPIQTSYALAKNLHDKFRTVYQDSSYSGRIPIAHTAYEYPEGRKLSQDEGDNFGKLEALTSPQALVAAGGLCAPLTPNYDIEVIGTSARPVKDQALTGVQVERGGLSFRPPLSAAAAVNGAGQWTLDNDEAASVVNNTGPTKSCYEVDCPGMENEYIWAAYLCLEFSNLTTRFDPETTTANLRQGDIAHARLADNLLMTKMAAESKLLSGAPVIGAVRDLLVNVDKASAYLRGRHRIDTALSFTWLAPFWVRHLMRADLARQMAAGDWKEALAPADSLIDSWFAARSVRPVWHMDGIGGTDEVQTVTITGSPTGGSFTLSYGGDTTDAIAYNATAAQVKAALAGLDTLDNEDITVTGGPGPGTAYVVTFGGSDSAGVNVAQMTSSGSFTGGTTPAVAVATTTGGDGAITVNGVTIPPQTYDNAAAGSAIPPFPTKIDSLLYPTGSWVFLDGGSLDLGLVRDSNLNARNRYRQFMETFEGAAFRGVESLRLVMEVEPNGGTAGTFDPSLITG